MMSLLQSGLADFDPSIAEEFGYAVTAGPSFLGVPLLEGMSLLHLIIRFAFNLIVSLVIVRGFYFRRGGSGRYVFTFMAFSSAMFLLLFLMESVKLQIGFTIGLFAIFGMIRYRTETIPVREMTYLFIIIALSVINGISIEVSYAELVLANLLIIGLIWVCESARGLRRTSTKTVQYDKIALIVPEKREELIADLSSRLGLKITAVEIGQVDFLKDSAIVKVTYETDEQHTIENVRKLGGDE